MSHRKPISLTDLAATPAARLNPQFFEKGTKISREVKRAANGQKNAKYGKTKAWVELQLMAWCESNRLTLHKEYRFKETRKWRADWFIEELNTLIEWEGLMSEKSRHTTATGYSNDATKYNHAIAAGFKIIRVTILNHKTLFTHLEKIKTVK